MAGPHLSDTLRNQVRHRADDLCEYCLLSQADTYFLFHIDHVISRKHGGLTELDNLALSCSVCNWAKGSDIGSIDPESQQLTRLFHPRSDFWADHFEFRGFQILGVTPVGRVTVRLLQFNEDPRIEERRGLMAVRAYPSPAAFKRIQR